MGFLDTGGVGSWSHRVTPQDCEWTSGDTAHEVPNSVLLRMFLLPFGALGCPLVPTLLRAPKTLQTQTGSHPLGLVLAPNHPFSQLETIIIGFPRVSAPPAMASGNKCSGSALMWFGFFSLSYYNGPGLVLSPSSFTPCPSCIDAVTWRIRNQPVGETDILGMVTHTYNPRTFTQEAEEEL